MLRWLLRLFRAEDGFGRISTGAAMVIALGGGIGAYYVATDGGTAPAGTANLWVDTNGGSCTRQATPADYVDAAACSAYSTAYTNASSGDTIRIKNGSYSSQTVSSGTKTLHYIGESLAGVVLSSLQVNGSNVTVDGFTTTVTASRGLNVAGSSVTVTNFSVNAASGDGSADGLTLSHGNIGPNNGCSGPEDGAMFGDYPGGGSNTLTNLLLDDISLHGTSGFTQCGTHMDGIQGFGCTNWTIRNSHFYDNDTSHILCLAHDTSDHSGPDNFLIENTQFGEVNNLGNVLDLECGNTGSNHITVRNNTFFSNGPLTIQDDGGGDSCNNQALFYGNVVTGSSSCNFNSGNTIVSYNTFTSGSCGTNSKTCTPGYQDTNRLTTGNGDINASDSCVKDAGNPAAYPATDIHGVTRPQGSLPDASANEVG